MAIEVLKKELEKEGLTIDTEALRQAHEEFQQKLTSLGIEKANSRPKMNLYGVKRTLRETNRSYKRRILKAARTVEGKALETIAVQYGIRRNAGETDASLRARIMAASKNRKGGPANGVQNRSRTKGNS